MNQIIIRGKKYLIAPCSTKDCAVGKCKCVFWEDDVCICPTKSSNGIGLCCNGPVMFIRLDQKLEYLAERLES